ncbi:MAG: hypothetical protein WAT39_12560 [Planctomycetota bacterium]
MRTALPAFTLFAALTAGCASTSADAAPSPQAVVEAVASENPDVTRLTVHCKKGEAAPAVCASTAKERIGTPSDPEDLRVLASGKIEVIEEGGAIDVTVPIDCKMGDCKSVCGVTLKGASLTKDVAVEKAKAIAKAVEARLGKGGAGCCDGGACCDTGTAAGGACCSEPPKK